MKWLEPKDWYTFRLNGADMNDDVLTNSQPPDWSVLWEWIKQCSGVDFQIYRQKILRRRAETWMARNNIQGPKFAVDFFRRHPEKVKDLIAFLTVDISDFFRNRPVFEYLMDAVLSHLAMFRPLKVFSLGCGRGQECYTIAMLLYEFFGNVEEDRVIGLDIDAVNLAQAVQGKYRKREVRGLTPEELDRYWVPDSSIGWRAGTELRRVVTFVQGSLLQPPFREGIADLILCRNVLIFIEPRYHISIFYGIGRLLRRGGYLVLGGVERIPRELNREFKVISMAHHVFQYREVVHGT